MPSRSRFLVTLVAAAVVPIAVACAGGSGDAGGSTAATTAATAVVATTAPDATAATTAPPPSSTPQSTVPPTLFTLPPLQQGGDEGPLLVPEDFDTIQEAVDAAVPGDLVLIAPGTYHESVDVSTDQLTIRGLDRDSVILDGELEYDNGIRVLGVQDVAVENLTVMNYTANAVFWVGATGYRASYVTTYRTGDYGIYAFESTHGLIEHSHTVGSRDAGVYIGQCYPCDAVVDDVLSTHNGVGYSGTNSGGNLLVVNSTFTLNRIGIEPNSGTYELCYPERETTIVGNLVYDNNATDSTAIDYAVLAQGNGILVAGGNRNIIERNRVDDHRRTGIGLIPYVETFPNDDQPTVDEWALSCDEQQLDTPVIPDGPIEWESMQNRVVDNVVTGSAVADLAVAATAGADASTLGNCFSGNVGAGDALTTAPLDLQALAPCDGAASGGDWQAGALDVAVWEDERASLPGAVDWRAAVLPGLGAHANLPDAATAPPAAAVGMPPAVDLDAITVPELP